MRLTWWSGDERGDNEHVGANNNHVEDDDDDGLRQVLGGQEVGGGRRRLPSFAEDEHFPTTGDN